MADYWPSCFSAFLCRTDIPWVQGFAFSSFLFPWRSRDSEVQGKKNVSGALSNRAHGLSHPWYLEIRTWSLCKTETHSRSLKHKKERGHYPAI